MAMILYGLVWICELLYGFLVYDVWILVWVLES